MRFAIAFAVSVITAVFGLATAAVVAACYAEWYRVGAAEGSAAGFIAGMAVMGGVVCWLGGLIAGAFGARNRRRRSGERRIRTRWVARPAAVACAVILALAGALLALFHSRADFPPNLDGRGLNLEVEIRLPAGAKPPPLGAAETSLTLNSVVGGVPRSSRSGELAAGRARREEGRWVVPGRVFLFTERGERAVEVQTGPAGRLRFNVPVPARPGPESEEWSGWLAVADGAAVAPAAPAAAFRFRIQRIPELPPPPDPGAATEPVPVSAPPADHIIPPGTPIGDVLAQTKAWQDADWRTAAVGHITAQPDFVADLSALMLDADPRVAGSALRFVAELPAPDPAFVASVQAAARDIVARQRKFNDSAPAADPYHVAAADVSMRFGPWLAAAGALRDRDSADLVPELREMLELSRVRTDSRIMQQEVRMPASLSLRDWAGIEPRPDDPTP